MIVYVLVRGELLEDTSIWVAGVYSSYDKALAAAGTYKHIEDAHYGDEYYEIEEYEVR